jgi:endonuclease/exonuclease/phosphatase family metal-dependent hydrolase
MKNSMTLLKWLSLLVGLPAAAIALLYIWGSASTYRQQDYAAITFYGSERPTEAQPIDSNAANNASYTIVSYNIGYLSGLTNNTTETTDKALFEANQAQAIAALKPLNPDILALQEIDFGSRRSYAVDQAEAIAQGTGLTFGAIAINWDKNYVPFPYWPPSAHFGKMLSGQALLSRQHPIEKNSRVVLARVADKPFFYNAFYLDRLAQVTQVSLNNRPIVVINVHLEAFDIPTRLNQTKFVRELAEDYAQTYPVILLGDFNSSPNRTEETDFSIEIMAASKQFVSAVPPDTWGKSTATFPSNQPEYKFDYIFYTPDSIEALQSQVVSAAAQASDHLPIMMRFRLK